MKKKSTKKIHVLPALAACVLLLTGIDVRSEGPDPILQYYWENATDKARNINSSEAAVSFVLSARTFCHRIGSGGRIASTDTVTCDYFYTGSTLDSIHPGENNEDCARKVDLAIPFIFDNIYECSLFPNDTGGPGLAIGLTSDSSVAGQPDGLVVIDRRDYAMKNLYLYYPEKEGYRRFTRSFRFVEYEGYLFPDSVWEVGTKLGIFSSENYRTETGVTQIEIIP